MKPPAWADDAEANTQPVSQDTLAGIPWAGRSTLAGLFQRVSARGPNDPSVWRRLIGRADVIAHSLNGKQASLVLSAMAKAQQRNEPFLRRFGQQFVPSLVHSAELVDLLGIVSSLSQLGGCTEETMDVAVERLVPSVPQMDFKQLSLVANAYVRAKQADTELFTALLQQVPRRLAGASAKDLAVLLNALAQLPSMAGAASAVSGRSRGVDAEALRPTLDAIALRLPETIGSADLHSLTLVLNAFAQLQFVQKDALDLLSEEVLRDEWRLQNATPRQLAMVVNAAARLQLYSPRLLEALTKEIKRKSRDLDAQGLCLVANAAAKLQLGVETFEVLYTRVPRHLARLTGRQLAMICHAWAKAHVHNDDLFQLVTLPLAQRVGTLTAHEVALAVYGYAHFRKSPPELFGPLLDRFATLMLARQAPTSDLLMVANALGRVRWHDARIAEGLDGYVQEEPSMPHLSLQTIETFALQA